MMHGLSRIRVRLLIANLFVVGITLGTVLVAVSFVGPGYFREAMGHRPGDPMGNLMDAATLAAFQEAVGTALIAATIIAVITAVIVGIAVSSRIAGPITRLASAAHRVALGNYAERVPSGSVGEIGELAASFNTMAGSLEATERRRLQLVGDVAHELRTPLATLDGYLEGLQDGVVASSAETWTLLRGETARLTRLVNELQDLWRAEARQLPLELETVDAAVICHEIADRFRPTAQARSITIETLAADGDLRVRVDRDRLAQILGNYVTNAIRYAPDGTAVTISVREADGEVEIGVRDQGPGLTLEQRAQVFERFYRVDPSRSRALGGSGIGLAIVRALTTAMGGHAWAESDGPGHGSTFLVALPAATLTES
jgi:histidine kinase